MVTRLQLAAALYEPAPPRDPHQVGRPAKKGPKLPKLQQVLVDPKTSWQPLTVANWYGHGPTQVEICTDTAVLYHNGMPAVPIRWVLIRNPNGKFKTRALLCTDQSATPRPNLDLVRPSLASRSDLSGSAHSLGRRDAAPIVSQSQCPHHTHFDGLVLMGDFGGSSIPKDWSLAHPTGHLVCQGRSQIWAHWGFCRSTSEGVLQKSHPDLLKRLFEAVCYST